MSAPEERRETQLESRRVYDGHVVNLRVDTVRTPSGATAEREVVEHRGSVGILVEDDQGRVLLVRQYRHAVGAATLEIPAGSIDDGEEPLAAARRELVEEAGLTARQWTPLLRFYPTPGFCSEWVALFRARGLTHGAPQPDGDEDLELVWLPLRDAVGRLQAGDGALADGKTALALLLAGTP